MSYPFPYKTLETQIEERVLSQCNKLLIDYKLAPGRDLVNENERYEQSQLKRLRDAGTFQELSETEVADLQYYRLIEVIRYEQITIFNLGEQMSTVELVPDVPEYSVPLLYVCPSMGLAALEERPPGLPQNCQAYLYPINLRLVLNREQTAFPDLTLTATESLIREGLKYVLDRASFTDLQASRSGYTIDSQVYNDYVGFVRSTLEGFMDPWEVFDYTCGLIIQEQATLAANF